MSTNIPDLEAAYAKAVAFLSARLDRETVWALEDLISLSIERVDRGVGRSYQSRRWKDGPPYEAPAPAGARCSYVDCQRDALPGADRCFWHNRHVHPAGPVGKPGGGR